MHHYIAFLRGIDRGKRRVKMECLAGLFCALTFTEVATFIGSGNVIFASRSADGARLERRIAAHLKASLGCAVETFVRTRAEVAARATRGLGLVTTVAFAAGVVFFVRDRNARRVS